MSTQILSTGWYCNGKQPADYTTHGDDSIRGLGFRPLWWESVHAFVKPERVFVVDSASPAVPDDTSYTNIPVEWLRLSLNPGHAQNTAYHYCGWMASVIHGLEYTISNDADYFLYVEQDALIFGENFVPQIEKQLRTHRYLFGSGDGTPWPLQQSVFAIRKDGIRCFLANLHRITHSDRLISPELKFAVSADHPAWRREGLMQLLHPRLPHRVRHSVGIRILRLVGGFVTLPFGYGRTRPINFDDKCFYFQHGSKSELSKYKKKIAQGHVTDVVGETM